MNTIESSEDVDERLRFLQKALEPLFGPPVVKLYDQFGRPVLVPSTGTPFTLNGPNDSARERDARTATRPVPT